MKQTVYIASPESQQIHVWNLNHEGALTLTQVVDVPGQVQPMVDYRTKFCVLIQHSPPKATNFSCYSQLLNAKEHS